MRRPAAVGGSETADPAPVEKAALRWVKFAREHGGSLPDAGPVAYRFGGVVRYPQTPDAPMARTAAETAAVTLSPETVLAQMKQNGVTDIVWLPDSETTPL